MSTINDFGIPGVGMSYAHPKQKNRWRITFGNMGNSAISSQPVSSQAVTVSKPALKFNEVVLHRYTSMAYVAGKYEWEPLKLTLEDDVTGAVSTVLQQQLQAQQWIVGAQGQWMAAAGEASLYKFATYLETLDGNDQVTERWAYEGCWITDINYDELDYASGEQVKISLTIRFDNANQTIGGYADGKGVALGGQAKVGPNNT